MCSGAFCRPHDSPQIVGVLQPVQQDHKGIFAPLFRHIQDLLHRGILIIRHDSDDALMVATVRIPVHPAFIAVIERDLLGFRLALDFLYGTFCTLCQNDLFDFTITVKGFCHGVPTDYFL